MADFSGIGAFGAGALQGADAALSRYATIDQIARQRAQEDRARQLQALQTLVSGNQLAQTSPDVAEMAARNPETYGLTPETIGPGAQQARDIATATAKLHRALQTGDLESIMDDPNVGKVIASKPKEYLGAIKEIQTRKKVDTILADPNLTPQQKAQMLIRAGANPPAGLLEAGYPELGGEQARQRALGTAQGQLPLAEALSQAKAVGQGKGELVTAGPLSQAKKAGELSAELSPEPQPGVPLGGTAAGRLAKERETEAQRRLRERNAARPTPGEPGPKDVSLAIKRVTDSARNDINAQLKTIRKGQWAEFTPVEQQQIHEYLVNRRMLAIAQSDPLLADQQLPELPRPAAMDKFEQAGQESGWNISEWLFGKSTPTPTQTPQPTPPRTLRTPTPAPTTGGWGKATVVR